MKNTLAIAIIVLFAFSGVASVHAENSLGANSDGTERVCVLGLPAQNEQGLVEALQRCKRGDILETSWIKSTVALQLCDFSKSVIYHPGNGVIFACVYTGNRRAVSKPIDKGAL